jgi:hypothetical protein
MKKYLNKGVDVTCMARVEKARSNDFINDLRFGY